MTLPNSTPAAPSRDDPGTTRCPVCDRRFTPAGRQTYCSTACRKTAFRRRHQHTAPAVTVPTARPRRQITVYECPDCGGRLLGEQRCPTATPSPAASASAAHAPTARSPSP